MRVIPAIDIIDGKCVRLTNGDYSKKKVYNENPIEIAKAFEDHGFKFLHLVDLDGAKSNHIVNHKVLELIATKTNLNIDFGGGLKSNKDLAIAFECGAKKITGGSVAVMNSSLFLEWIDIYGPDKIILGSDVNGEKIAINGWLETSNQTINKFLSFYIDNGVRTTICTDVSKDGMLKGPSISLYKKILKQNSIDLIASGGISKIDDITQLSEIGCEGAIIGKAIYEKSISLKELEKYNLNN
jgi:phosphoribosylformimino-5-aminoimidazole carboxamide ribotide isomerase